MIGAILSFLGSGAFGSIAGIFGNWLNQRQIRQTKQMEMDHEVTMARVNIEALKAKTDASIKITEAKVKGVVDLEEAKAYTTNIVVGNQKSFSDKWLDKMLEATGWWRIIAYPFAGFLMTFFGLTEVIKGLMRPTLTLAFTAGFGLIAYVSYNIIEARGIEHISIEQAILYFTLAVDTCILLTTTCVTWWYADRRMAKTLARMTEKRLEMNKPVMPGIEIESERRIEE